MKNIHIILLMSFTIFSFQSCQKDGPQPAWVEYCEDVSGGELNVNIDGKNWRSGCVQSHYSETITPDYTTKLLWAYAYNYEATYYNASEIEAFVIFYSEITANGETEITSGASFTDGFVLTDQESDDWEGNHFETDESENDQLNITQLTSTMASGSFNFKLYKEEDAEQEISVNGTFSAVIEQ